ncbi:MAG: hypothetical protein H6Q30_1596 [Bacteroidetes bacterium]|nr:hypothetical protein [Bacteroidota bacterium]
MRPFTIFILLTALGATVFAQEETLLTSDHETGGFGGPVAKFTRINGQNALMLGGRGGWIVDHSFVIGGGAYGVATEVDAASNILPEQGPLNIDFSCFGLEVEYIFRPDSLVHLSLYALVGGGAVRFVKDRAQDTQVDETDLAFVFEPTANAELNLTTWCRIMAGVSYRIVAGVTQIGLTNRDFTGPSASLTVKFGSF